MNTATHARDAFYTHCNGYVSCVDQCAREVGPIDTLPKPGAEQIDPSKLDVRLALVPASIADTVNEGWFVIVLSVTNPFAHSVRTRLPSVANNPDFVQRDFFGIAPSGPKPPTAYLDGGSNYRFLDDSSGFDAGETRRLVIDESAMRLRLQPGTEYSVSGGFNLDTAKTLSFTFR